MSDLELSVSDDTQKHGQTPPLPSLAIWSITEGEETEVAYLLGLLQLFETIPIPLSLLALTPAAWSAISVEELQRVCSELRPTWSFFFPLAYTGWQVPPEWRVFQGRPPALEVLKCVLDLLPHEVRDRLHDLPLQSRFFYSLKRPAGGLRLSLFQRNPARIDQVREVLDDFRPTEVPTAPTHEQELLQLREEVLQKDIQIRRLNLHLSRYQRFFEEDITGDVLMDSQWRILECNGSFLKIFGFPSKSFALGYSLKNLFLQLEVFKQIEETLELARGLHNYELDMARYPLEKTDRNRVNVIANFLLSSDPNSGESVILGFLFDNTLRKSLERQLYISQRMEGLGRLAGGIAHDFNNLLTVINGYAELLMSELPAGTSLARDIAAIMDAGQKAAKLTSQLLAFSRRQMRTPGTYNLNRVIEGMQSILSRLLRESIQIEFDPDPNLPLCTVDKAQFEQALLNLALNAQDAMEGQGTLTIRTRRLKVDRSIYDGKDLVLPGLYAELTVIDSGKGIPEEHLPYIFEPFYSTKEPGQGTGLGLATVYGIVQQNQAHIFVDSQVGQGSTFRILFPAQEQGEDVWVEPQPEASLPKLSILLVEDDDMIKEFTSKILSRNGHKVQAFGRAEDLLEFPGLGRENWDILITDVVMPTMSGPEMVLRLREKRIDLPVLYLSGYPDNELEKYGLASDNPHFLHKPFRTGELFAKITQVLTERLKSS